MKRWLWLALPLILSGCLGKAGPTEEFLRILGGDAPCRQAVSGGTTVVGVKNLKASETLERQAVLLARGRVLTPSPRWYWEAEPGRLATQALARSIGCRGSVAVAWPIRSTTRADAVVSGQVSVFEVREAERTMAVALTCQVLDGEERRILGTREFATVQPVAAFTAQGVAEAASTALTGLAGEAGEWIAVLAAERAPDNRRK